jgi:hypothetical protein
VVATDGGSVVVASFIAAAFALWLGHAGRIERRQESNKKPIVTFKGEADTPSGVRECLFPRCAFITLEDGEKVRPVRTGDDRLRGQGTTVSIVLGLQMFTKRLAFRMHIPRLVEVQSLKRNLQRIARFAIIPRRIAGNAH